jgi:hypothetical protein
MSGSTILKAKILLKVPVDPVVSRWLYLLASGEIENLDEDDLDLPDHAFWKSPYFMLQQRITFDGREVVVNAEIKNKRHELDKFLLWLAPSIEKVEDASWYDTDGLDDDPLELLFSVEDQKFTLRGPGCERGLIIEPSSLKLQERD